MSAIAKKKRVFCFLQSIFEKTALLGTLALTLLLSIRPWKSYFLTGLGEHWDTKVMGHWMAWNAHHILQGDFLFPNYHAGYFYPHMYTLAFGEMLWPQSFIYAGVWGISKNPFLSYNVAMLFFWSLTGVTMYMLLRELKMSRAVGYLGGFIYCLMPFMMAFYIEINMTLTFVIPLILLLFVRWLEEPTLGRAILFCAGFLIAITSCIYYTYMVAIPLIFIFSAYVVRNRSILRQKRFYASAGVMIAGVAIIATIYLYPYVILRMEGGYVRGLKDFQISHAQALHYLDTRSAFLIHSLFNPPVRWSETYLFPGSVLALISLVFMGAGAAQHLWEKPQQGWRFFMGPLSKLVLWSLFWSIIIVNAFSSRTHGSQVLLLPASLGLLTVYIVSLYLPSDASREKGLIAAMATGAVFCFFVSLGPVLTVHHDAHLLKLGYGPLSGLFMSTPIFGLVRGLTRFAIIPLTYLLVAGCFALNQLVIWKKRLIWVFPVLVLLLVYEASHIKYRYEDYTDIYDSAVMQQVRKLPRNSVLFQIPTSPKVINNNIVMNTIGDFHFTINGISGFVPKAFSRIEMLLRDWKVTEVTHRLTQIWPKVFLVLDRPATRWLARGWKKPFPWKRLEDDWNLLAQDANYALYALRQAIFRTSRIVRRVRTDLLQKNATLTFNARQTSELENPAEFGILLNGHKIAGGMLKRSWQKYAFDLPKSYMGQLSGEKIVLQLKRRRLSAGSSLPGGSWEVRDIEFIPPAAPEKPDAGNPSSRTSAQRP